LGGGATGTPRGSTHSANPLTGLTTASLHCALAGGGAAVSAGNEGAGVGAAAEASEQATSTATM
jgi:hypothetical protein